MTQSQVTLKDVMWNVRKLHRPRMSDAHVGYVVLFGLTIIRL